MVFAGLKGRRGRPSKSGGADNVEGQQFVCRLCTSSFRRRHHLYRHEMNAHGAHAVPSVCHVCLRVFKNRDSLRRHINIYHRDESRAKKTSNKIKQESLEQGDEINTNLT